MRLAGPSPEFPPTRWSVIGRAGAEQDAGRHEAMDILYRAYEYPILRLSPSFGAFTPRRAGLHPRLLRVCDRESGFRQGRQEKGRFRSFLLASLKNFISTQRRRLAAQKRGGGESARFLG